METKVDLEKLLAEGKVIRIKIRGYSMYPVLLPERDEVFIKQTELSELRRGDVLLYRREQGILVLHRLWKRKGNQFFMVGDNQSEIEGPLEGWQIKGKMIAMIRKGGYIPVEKSVYRILCGIWLFLRPFRPFISNIVHRIKRNRTKGR